MRTQSAAPDGGKCERGERASILLYFFDLRLEEAWLAFLEVAGRF